jgi:hypothetical protein
LDSGETFQKLDIMNMHGVVDKKTVEAGARMIK